MVNDEKEKELLLEARYCYSKDLKALKENPTAYLCLCVGSYFKDDPEQVYKLDFTSEYNEILKSFLKGEIEKIDIILGI
jgi:hypothetical protein